MSGQTSGPVEGVPAPVLGGLQMLGPGDAEACADGVCAMPGALPDAADETA